jgi:hypothetical protein
MKTATGLILIAVGAILAFAVTTSTPVFNLNVAGYVIMLVGLAGLFIPRRGYANINRRFITRRSRTGPRGTVIETQETDLPPYVTRNPGTSPEQAGLPTSTFPSIPVDRGVQERAVGPDHGVAYPGETEIVDHIDE